MMDTPAGDSHTQRQRESLLNRYDKELDLYKFYLDIGVKGSLFAFGLTGALLSFFFLHRTDTPILVWSLVLPIVLNAGLFVLFRASIAASAAMIEDHKATSAKLDSVQPFNLNPLWAICRLFSYMYLVVVIGLIILLLLYGTTSNIAQPR